MPLHSIGMTSWRGYTQTKWPQSNIDCLPLQSTTAFVACIVYQESRFQALGLFDRRMSCGHPTSDKGSFETEWQTIKYWLSDTVILSQLQTCQRGLNGEFRLQVCLTHASPILAIPQIKQSVDWNFIAAITGKVLSNYRTSVDFGVFQFINHV
jgi:hypothetical protein